MKAAGGNMSEYIKREDAVRVIKNYGKGAISDGLTALNPVDVVVALANAVERLSAEDVEPIKHGRWIDNGSWGFMLSSCSVCGFAYRVCNFLYCPHCGSKMDEVSE